MLVVLHVRNSNILAPTVSAFALAIPSIAVRPIDVPILILNRLGYKTCCTRADAGMLHQFWSIFACLFSKLQSWQSEIWTREYELEATSPDTKRSPASNALTVILMKNFSVHHHKGQSRRMTGTTELSYMYPLRRLHGVATCSGNSNHGWLKCWRRALKLKMQERSPDHSWGPPWTPLTIQRGDFVELDRGDVHGC